MRLEEKEHRSLARETDSFQLYCIPPPPYNASKSVDPIVIPYFLMRR